MTATLHTGDGERENRKSSVERLRKGAQKLSKRPKLSRKNFLAKLENMEQVHPAWKKILQHLVANNRRKKKRVSQTAI